MLTFILLEFIFINFLLAPISLLACRPSISEQTVCILYLTNFLTL